MVNDTVLNFGERYEDNLRVIFDQWPKLHLSCAKQSKNLERYLIIYALSYEPLGRLEVIEPILNAF